MEFGGQVRNDFELRALDAQGEQIGPRWRHTAARRLLEESLDGRVFRWSAWIFSAGVLITLASAVVERCTGAQGSIESP